MTKARTKPRRTAAAQTPAVAPALLSVADMLQKSLALHAAKHVLDREMISAKKFTPEYLRAKAGFTAAQETAAALDDFAINLPVRTLPDAAAWALFCFSELDALRTSDAVEKAGLSSSLDVIFRGIAGMAIVLAEATGQDLDKLADTSTARLMRMHAGAGIEV